MVLNHIHLYVQDLPEALRWMEQVWESQPTFRNERMAVLTLGKLTLILDQAQLDSEATLGFESDDCLRDYTRVLKKGATGLEPPSLRPWGALTAYIQGPGNLKFEIEQNTH
jgi:hypothetical protein